MTSNFFSCLELIAHCFLRIARFAQAQYPSLKVVSYFLGSQLCEDLFRLLRSYSPQFSVTVNFGFATFHHRLKAAQSDLIAHAAFGGSVHALGIEYPEHRKRHHSWLRFDMHAEGQLVALTDGEIEAALLHGLNTATSWAHTCKLNECLPKADFPLPRPEQLRKLYPKGHVTQQNDEDADEDDDTDACWSVEPVSDGLEESVEEALSAFPCDLDDPVLSPWVLNLDGKPIHKSTVVARMNATLALRKASNDRLLRVRGQKQLVDDADFAQYLSVGSWGAFLFETRNNRQEHFVGQIMHFRCAATHKPLHWQKVHVEERKGVEVLVVWYKHSSGRMFAATMDDPTYYDLFALFYILTDFDCDVDKITLSPVEYQDLLLSFENVRD